MSERIDIRLSEEEKKRLAELANQRGVSMTDLIRTWIIRGDVVHVLAEQLQEFVNDFNKWHVSENRNTSIRYLCSSLQGQMGAINDVSRRMILYKWTEFFDRTFQLVRNDVLDLSNRLTGFIIQKEPKEKMVLVRLIRDFIQIASLYHNVFVQGFLDILQNMNEDTKRSIGETYNDELRTRYNEITSKCEDFLKRAQRELGEGLEHALPRAKEFRAKE